MAEIPEGWVSKKEAIELTALSPRTFERTVRKRGIEQKEVPIEGRRPIIIYPRNALEDMKRHTVVERPEVVRDENTGTAPPRQTLPTVRESGEGAVQALETALSAIASDLSLLPLTGKLTLTLKEAVVYSGLPKTAVLSAIHGGGLAVVYRNPYRIRRSDIDAFVAGMTVGE